MAKRKFEIDAEDFDVEKMRKEKEEVKKENTETEYTIHNTQSTIYKIEEKPKEEIRNKRIQIVVKPSLKSKLDYLVTHGHIKSINDFANFVFERGVEELESAHGFEIDK